MSTQSDVRERRMALGMSKSALAREAKINRDTLGDLESGKGFQAATLDKITEALDRLELEAGIGAPLRAIGDPQERLVQFEVPTLNGVTFVVKGPIEDADLLRQQALELYRSTHNETPSTSQNGNGNGTGGAQPIRRASTGS